MRVLSEKITVFISGPERPCSVPRPSHLEELFWSGALAEIRSYGPVVQPITTNQMTDRQQYGHYTGMERGGEGGEYE